MQELAQALWFKSSYSSSSQGCVEVALTPAVVGIRDTKDRDGGTLIVDRERWKSFLRAVAR
ncbi:DUF397 domain-containing protein [Saccharopolyspora sp. NFXS83]|uniref:DUF397 domain-containing protein n=1 Tax=Saccharopolyspora sp. NFXS83 TaxID=2993560 RepID=UPI00224A76E2|nr:DUF397 domain-containing protein [Saccharopolyspora sp. NFXS83]MCX2730849.1 DUF397 domain-containing protein [Saccharopolyspora sp. NFXS83]